MSLWIGEVARYTPARSMPARARDWLDWLRLVAVQPIPQRAERPDRDRQIVGGQGVPVRGGPR